MYYRRLVEETYRESIALNNKIPDDLRSALKAHERIPLFLNNLALELDKLQIHRQKKGQETFTDAKIKSIVYDFTDVFITGIKAEAEAKYQSDIQKQLMQKQIADAKDLDATASGKVSGEFADIFKEGGITMTDERSV